MKLFTYVTYKKLYEVDVKQDIVLRAKNTNIIDLYCLDENDVVVDITGSEIYFMIKDIPSQDDASAKINKKITSFTDPTNGNTEIELTSAETASLLGNYIYQIKIKYNSKFYTLSEGNICFTQSIISKES